MILGTGCWPTQASHFRLAAAGCTNGFSIGAFRHLCKLLAHPIADTDSFYRCDIVFTCLGTPKLQAAGPECFVLIVEALFHCVAIHLYRQSLDHARHDAFDRLILAVLIEYLAGNFLDQKIPFAHREVGHIGRRGHGFAGRFFDGVSNHLEALASRHTITIDGNGLGVLTTGCRQTTDAGADGAGHADRMGVVKL